MLNPSLLEKGGEVMVSINGENIDGFDNKPLIIYLNEKNYVISRIAVERNGKIVPKTEYSNTILCDRDCIEIVHFVGGG